MNKNEYIADPVELSEARITQMIDVYKEDFCMQCGKKVNYELVCLSPLGDSAALCYECAGIPDVVTDCAHEHTTTREDGNGTDETTTCNTCGINMFLVKTADANEPQRDAWLCFAYGETDMPSARFCYTRSQVETYLCEEWFGSSEDTDLPWRMKEFDEHDFNDKRLEWEFEIGGIWIERVVACRPSGWTK